MKKNYHWDSAVNDSDRNNKASRVITLRTGGGGPAWYPGSGGGAPCGGAP